MPPHRESTDRDRGPRNWCSLGFWPGLHAQHFDQKSPPVGRLIDELGGRVRRRRGQAALDYGFFHRTGADDKTNKPCGALRLLEGMIVPGCRFTGDMLLCNREVSELIIDATGHYVVFTKNNQMPSHATWRTASAVPSE